MSALRTRKGGGRRSSPSTSDQLLGKVLPFLTEIAKTAGMVGGCALLMWLLHQAQLREYRQPKYHEPIRIQLANAPAGLDRLIRKDLAELAGWNWIDGNVCRSVHDRLAQSPWIQSIHRVSKPEPGLVRVKCQYRLPVALVQDREYFYMVDEYGVRLPGQHGYEPGWLLIQGVEGELPSPGEQWPGEDLAAGVRLANMILAQPYRDQVSAVLVHNYGGRRAPYRSHLELLAGRDGHRILWGSAPGEELEENSTAQKLRILAANYRRYGTIDADQPTIDISVLPDRFLIPDRPAYGSGTTWTRQH